LNKALEICNNFSQSLVTFYKEKNTWNDLIDQLNILDLKSDQTVFNNGFIIGSIERNDSSIVKWCDTKPKTVGNKCSKLIYSNQTREWCVIDGVSCKKKSPFICQWKLNYYHQQYNPKLTFLIKTTFTLLCLISISIFILLLLLLIDAIYFSTHKYIYSYKQEMDKFILNETETYYFKKIL
jgi:hypothetical protein